MAFLSDVLGKNTTLLGRNLAFTLVLVRVALFLLTKLAMIFFNMIFGLQSLVRLSMASLHLGATRFKIRLLI